MVLREDLRDVQFERPARVELNISCEHIYPFLWRPGSTTRFNSRLSLDNSERGG